MSSAPVDGSPVALAFELAAELLADQASGPTVSVTDAARDLGVPKRTVRHWCEDGTLRGARKVNRRGDWRIPLRQVQLMRVGRAKPCPTCGRCS